MRSWCGEKAMNPAGLLPVEQLWWLAVAWYSDRLSPEWRRRTAAEVDVVFASVGLTGEFWKLTP